MRFVRTATCRRPALVMVLSLLSLSPAGAPAQTSTQIAKPNVQGAQLAKPTTQQTRFVNLQTRTVPDVMGIWISEANTSLEKAGLKSDVVISPATELSCVSAQRPAPGTKLNAGGTVHLELTTDCNPVRVQVPDLMSMSQSDAAQRLQAVGLALGSTSTDQNDQTAGTVVRQSPGPGRTVPIRSSVAVSLSSGPQTKDGPVVIDVRVPKLIGRTSGDANVMIQKAGLTVGPVTTEVSSRTPGTVVRQEPEPGRPVKSATTVAYVLAAAALVVPDVTGLSRSDAETRLGAAGFSLGEVDLRPSEGPEGLVLSQEPAAETQYMRGIPVAIVLSRPALIEVPSLRGLLLSEAKARLKPFGLDVGDLTPTSFQRKRARVSRQDPAPGEQVERGTHVDLVFVDRTLIARVWAADSDATAGDSVTMGVDVTPTEAGLSYWIDFGDHRNTGWIETPRVKHAYAEPNRYEVTALVRAADGELVRASTFPITVHRDLTALLTALVLGGAIGLPFAAKLIQRLPIPAFHVRLQPWIGDASLHGAVPGRPVWALAIATPGPVEARDVEPPDPEVRWRRES
ncbi:MAG TPA: PASTA domain-containing protein [Candidatus Eisenbacteria bacterium]|nr:PASTA domain-containing protein [Candidatus Eisenbacteria bacterium]